MQQALSVSSKKREYLFDNYKVLLIALVVISHFIEPNYKHNDFLYELKWIIISFHMPAFIFISGYFSKRTPSIKKLINSLVIPYFVYEVVYYLLYTFIIHKETKLYLAHPKFSLWYLMALFAWKLLTPIIIKIPGHMIWSLLAGLAVGFSGLDNFLSIPRILYFYPFFLAGVHFDNSWLEKIRTTKMKYGAAATLVILTLILSIGQWHHSLSPKIFYGRYSYAELGQGPLEGILIRILCYGISFLISYLLLILVPSERNCLSYLGERTMAIYIFHGLIYSYLKYDTRLLSFVDTTIESILLIIFCLVLTWCLARKPFVHITNKIAHLLG